VHLAVANEPTFVPESVKYCPPFSESMDGVKEETTGLEIDCNEKDDEKSDPVTFQDTTWNLGCKAENGKVHST
jgi:hypothetical protein